MSALARLVSRRRTESLAALALATVGGLCFLELRHVWRRGSAQSSAEAGDYVKAGREAGRETVAVIREGYHAGSARENATFNMLVAFTATFGAARAVTHVIRTGKGPFANLIIGERHIHHFVPGILIAFGAGGASIGMRREALDKWLAVPFGAGVALVFDEAALLLALEDVYWSREGVVSVQITLGTAALMASLGLAARLVHRGEPYVFASQSPMAAVPSETRWTPASSDRV